MALFETFRGLADKVSRAQSIGRVVDNLVVPEREKLPLVMCMYLTYRCNAACGFCSQDEYVRGDKKGDFQMYDGDLERRLQILEIVRREVPNIYFLGGEPTVYPGFKAVLEQSERLKFESVAVNTNAILYKPEILEHCDLLVASLHCDDSHKLADMYGIFIPKAEGVYENIRRYADERDPGKTRMVINCVVTGGGIDDAWDVIDFASREGVQVNIAPAIGKDGRPDPKLVGSAEYKALIDWLLK